jgi:hypothetical protein
MRDCGARAEAVGTRRLAYSEARVSGKSHAVGAWRWRAKLHILGYTNVGDSKSGFEKVLPRSERSQVFTKNSSSEQVFKQPEQVFKQPEVFDEVLMLRLRWVLLGGMAILSIAPAAAQIYDPSYPVCLKRWEWGGNTIIDCNYTSWDQCRMETLGLSGMCLDNPYWTRAHPSRQGGLLSRKGRIR